jgi:hypothetical protein
MTVRQVGFGAAVCALGVICVSHMPYAYTATARACEARMSYEQSSAIKRELVAKQGGQMRDYELDHCIPLCLDGSNDRSNLQLQPWSQARIKDDDELRLCKAVSSGSMSRSSAILELQTRWGCK